MSDLRYLHLRSALGAVRTEKWDGRDHLVVPVVALQEAVIHAVNSKVPEFVPVTSLQKSQHAWNGHPLVVGHPVKDGQQISAHDPAILEKHGFGFIRQAIMNGTRLGMEAMIDPARLQALGHQKLLADLEAGKPIEVSVGAFVNTNAKVGTFQGKNYKGEWVDIVPDHLAFLPNGIGACSLAMGCGSGRMATAHLVTEHGLEALAGPMIDKAQVVVDQGKGAKKMRGRVMPKSTLKDRILALFDTPEQAASEEAAELVGYQIVRTHLDAMGKAWDDASGIIDDLIADETENPTETSAQEEAEEEVESARLDALMSLLSSMAGTASSAMSMCMNLNSPDLPEPTDPRYMEAFRAAYGKTISAATMKKVQAAHDNAHAMHDHTTGLGANCNGMRLLAGKNCPACDGMGQVISDDKQVDCPTCDGSGKLKTAEAKEKTLEFKAACSCTEGSMKTKAERITALMSNEHNPLKDLKALEANTEEGLRLLEEHCEKAATLKAAADKLATDQKASEEKAAADLKAAEEKAKTVEERLTSAETALKTAQAAQIPAEELATMRALAEAKKAEDAKTKTTLVAQLKTAAAGVYTEAELNAMDILSLTKIAALAKVDAPDYSGRAMPMATRVAAETYAPPDPYAAGIKALQGAAN